MSDNTPTDASRGKIGFLLTLILIAGGSVLILFPAWLSGSAASKLGEDSAVELLQLVFLVLSSALYFAAAPHAGRLKPIFRALAVGALAAALGEYARPLQSLITPIEVEWFITAMLIYIGYTFLRNYKAFSRFWGYASKRPAAGFLLAGLILAYVFGEVFGSNEFWEASLGGGFNPDTPEVVESYLELLACYFIFVASVGFCLPVTKRGKIARIAP